MIPDHPCRRFPLRRVPFLLAAVTLSVMMLPFHNAEAASFRDFLKKKAEQVQDVLQRVDKDAEEDAQTPVQSPSPTSTASPAFSPQQVQRVQYLLTELGYQPGPVDGAFGPGTASAISRYQADHGLSPNGMPSAELVAHLSSTLQTRNAAGPTATGSSPTLSTVAPAPAPAAATGSGSLVAPAPGGAVPVSAPAQSAVATPAPSAGAPASASAVAAAQAGLPVVRGRPLIVTGGYTGIIENAGIASADEIAAIGTWLDHVRIGLNPDIARASEPGKGDPRMASYADNRALCVANRLLAPAGRNEILKGEVDPLSGDKQFRSWKGSGDLRNAGANEFEIQRAKQRFNELLPELVAAAPRLPMKFVFIEPLMLEAYDHNKGGFPFRPPMLELPQSPCLGIDNDYLPIATELPSLWALDPTAGEAVIKRIPVDTGFFNQQRKVFVAVELTLSGAPEARIRGKLKDETLVPLKVDVESVALYEDPDLERHLYTFSVDAPAPAVLLAGVPERVPMPDPALLSEEMITLLLLDSHGDVLSEVAWNVLARQHSFYDQYYYKKERYLDLPSSTRIVELDGYDPNYLPFFPLGKSLEHHQQLDPDQLDTFRKWSLARAAALGERFEIVGILDSERAQQGGFTGNVRLQIGDPSSEYRKVIEQIEAAGYAPGRIVRPSLAGQPRGTHLDSNFLASPEGARATYFVMPHPLDRLTPAVATADLQRDEYDRTWPAFMEVGVTKVELVELAAGPRAYENRASEAVLIHLAPRSIRVLSADGSQTLFEQDYDLAMLDAEAASKAKAVADAQATAQAAEQRAAADAAAYRQQLTGADIAGLKLGMTLAEAEQLIRSRLDVRWVATGATEAQPVKPSPVQPYLEFKTYISADGNEQIVLFAHEDLNDEVVGITRTVALADGTSVDGMVAALREKYGEPVYDPPPSPGVTKRMLQWSTDIEDRYGQKAQREACRSELTSWSVAWLKVDGREFTFDEQRTISTMTPVIRVRGGHVRQPQERWDFAQWRGCGASVIAEVGDVLPGNRLGLRIAVLNLGAYTTTYEKWVASQQSAAPALPEL